MKKHKPNAPFEVEVYEEISKVQKDVVEIFQTLRNLHYRFDDMVEMHQKEITALKQEFTLLEEKISYYIAMKLQDFDEKIQESNANIASLERQLFLWTSIEQTEKPHIAPKLVNTLLAFLSVIMILTGMAINIASPIFASRRNYMVFVAISLIAIYFWYRGS